MPDFPVAIHSFDEAKLQGLASGMSAETQIGLSYNDAALKLLTRMTQSAGAIDQPRLRHIVCDPSTEIPNMTKLV